MPSSLRKECELPSSSPGTVAQGPAHVEALTEVARADFLHGGGDTALASAQRAIALADELGLDRSPRTLGYLGFARGRLGDLRGLGDMREAIRLATDGGLGREVGVLHSNLGIQLWAYEGPQAALDEFDVGIIAAACGLNEILDLVSLSRIDPLIDAGRIDEVLEVAMGSQHASRSRHRATSWTYAALARVHTLRGTAAQVAGWLDWLESSAHAVSATCW